MSVSKKLSYTDAAGKRNCVLVDGETGFVRELRRGGLSFSPYAGYAYYDGPERLALSKASTWDTEDEWRIGLPAGTIVVEETVPCRAPRLVVAPAPTTSGLAPTGATASVGATPATAPRSLDDRVRDSGVRLPRLVISVCPKEAAFTALCKAIQEGGDVAAARKAYDAAVPYARKMYVVVKGDENTESVWIADSAIMAPVYFCEAEGRMLFRRGDNYYVLGNHTSAGIYYPNLWKKGANGGIARF